MVLLTLILIVACVQEKNEGIEPVTGQHVKELEETACNAADEAGTCSTRLANLGFVTEEQCCTKYGKCC